MSKHATQKSKHAFINQHPTGTHSPGSNPPAPTPTTPTSFQTSLLDPQRELSYIFQDHLNTGTKLLPVSRGYYFIPGGKGQRLPLPLCISGQHKSVFHDLFCSIANSPLQSLTFLYPSLYLSVGDLVCLGDCVRRSKHLTRLKLPNLKSEVEAFDPTQTPKSEKYRVLHAHPAWPWEAPTQFKRFESTPTLSRCGIRRSSWLSPSLRHNSTPSHHSHSHTGPSTCR
ncbi:hypothetical protein Pcinc_026341 [Petrolisthes cinctipes]|uniref:Uncharacterized protein n=1 Tax=Petrolisthes cinctipes TaxID=88211 RepID=A0AAE1KAG5_PETCI|nr:hypothetical protein Pcinc_026341 [Petrolisthes cinctipes]